MKGRQNDHFLKPAYAEALEISAAKKKDLTELCSMNVIPKSDWNFYQGLRVGRETEETTVEMYEDRESEEDWRY